MSNRTAPRRTALGRRRRSVTAALLAITLLSACASAHAQSTRSAADRLRITTKRDRLSVDVGAVVTATGCVPRGGSFDAATLPGGRYTARLLLAALPRARHCPRRAPSADGPYRVHHCFYTMRISQLLAIGDAFEVARRLRLYGYVTAKRRTPSEVRMVTVAHASTTVTGPVQQNSSEEPAWAYRVAAWVITLALCIGISVGLLRLGRWWIHDTPAARDGGFLPTSDDKNSPPR